LFPSWTSRTGRTNTKQAEGRAQALNSGDLLAQSACLRAISRFLFLEVWYTWLQQDQILALQGQRGCCSCYTLARLKQKEHKNIQVPKRKKGQKEE